MEKQEIEKIVKEARKKGMSEKGIRTFVAAIKYGINKKDIDIFDKAVKLRFFTNKGIGVKALSRKTGVDIETLSNSLNKINRFFANQFVNQFIRDTRLWLKEE